MVVKFFVILGVAVLSPQLLSGLRSSIAHRSYKRLNGTHKKPNCISQKIPEWRLQELIFRNHSSEIRPRKKANDPVKVKMALTLYGIEQFIERQNTVVLKGSFHLDWTNDFVAWDHKYPYNCIRELLVDVNRIWTPDLSLIRGHLGSIQKEDSSLYTSPSHGKAKVLSNGHMYLDTMARSIYSNCEINLSAYPFDTQICSIFIESWHYPRSMQDVQLLMPESFKRSPTHWIENEQWQIVDNISQIMTPANTGNVPAFSRVVFSVLLRRKAMFHYVFIIIPSITIAIVELVTFFLPIMESVKVHISFTCLLAYLLFQDMIIDELPRSSENAPLLSIFIDLQMAYIGLIAILGNGIVFLLIRQAKTTKKRPPKLLFETLEKIGNVLSFGCATSCATAAVSDSLKARRFKCAILFDRRYLRESFSTIGPIFGLSDLSTVVEFIKFSRLNASSNNNQIDLAGINNRERRRKSSSMANKGDEGKHEMSAFDQWIFVAEALERINMWVYLAAISVTPAVMFHMLPPEKTLGQAVIH